MSQTVHNSLDLHYDPEYFYYEDLQHKRAGQPISADNWNHLWALNERATNNNSYALDCLLNTGDMMTYWDKIQNTEIANIKEDLEGVHEDLDNLTNRVDNLELEKGSFGLATNVRKIKDYLYEAHYNDIDYKTALDYFKEKSLPPFYGCSSFRTYNFHCRNLDWFYNHGAEFIVHTPRIGKRWASVGMAGGLMTDEEALDTNDVRYKLLPFALYDGINECGVVANVNVVPKATNGVPTVPTDEIQAEIPMAMIVRFILDHFSTAFDATEYIVRHASLLFPKSIADMDYELQIFISDEDESYYISFVQGTADATLVSPSMGNIITNFRRSDVIPNDDGTVYTPLDVESDPTKDPVAVNHMNPYGSGLERYNEIVYALEQDNISTYADAMDLLEQLKYTNAYDTNRVNTGNFWYTEFVSKNAGRTVSTPASDYANILPAIETIFANRSRDDGYTWHTVHSAVYDIDARRMYLVTQEDYTDVITIDVEEQIGGSGGGTGDGDMKKSIYDTHNHAEDIFDYVDNHIPDIPVATASTPGIVQPDNTSITIDDNGIISAHTAAVESNMNSTVWYRFALKNLDSNNPDLSFVRMEVK